MKTEEIISKVQISKTSLETFNKDGGQVFYAPALWANSKSQLIGFDLDILIEATPKNVQRLLDALLHHFSFCFIVL